MVEKEVTMHSVSYNLVRFLGRRWEITPGETKQVAIVQQPASFRVIARPPTPQEPQWLDILAEHRL